MMTRSVGIACWIALAIPCAVLAQVTPAPAGVVRGSVETMNLPNGIVRVRAGKNLVTLDASPAQLAGLAPGDVVELPYVDYGGTLWLSPEVGGGLSWLGPHDGVRGRISGAVQVVACSTGQLGIRGTRLRVHPAQLQGIAPGMVVDVMYVTIGTTGWVTAIAPGERRAGAP